MKSKRTDGTIFCNTNWFSYSLFLGFGHLQLVILVLLCRRLVIRVSHYDFSPFYINGFKENFEKKTLLWWFGYRKKENEGNLNSVFSALYSILHVENPQISTLWLSINFAQLHSHSLSPFCVYLAFFAIFVMW